MNAALVKIDVAAAILGEGVRVIERRADGGDLMLKGLVWVFDFANDPDSRNGRKGAHIHDRRFWVAELNERAKVGPNHTCRYANWELDWVIAKILPERRKTFQAGEVDQLFQIRHNTRLAFGDELNGNKLNGANTYERANLVRFLENRWLGNCYDRQRDVASHQKNGRNGNDGPCGEHFHPAHAAEERDNGRGTKGRDGQSPKKALAQSLEKVATAG